MRETPWYRLIIFLTCLMKVTEIQAQCERPDVGENRLIVDDSGQKTYPNGSTLTFKCATGYRPVDLSAPKIITCVGTQWTKLELNCTKKSCGALPDFPNGKYTYPDGILFGATAIAQCNTGFSLLGENTRNCRENGWDGRDPVCEAVKCEPPPSIQNGTFDPLDDFYNYGQAVTYSCIRDYNLIGESTIVCSANGTFHPPPPRCLLVECEAPNIKNAVRVEGKPPPYRYKNFVRYQCNKGYIMNGSGYLVCEENGWNPPPPECITQCERPDVGENRLIVDDSGQKTFPNGSTLTFKCATGYRPVDLSAPKIITCVGTQWTKLELNCTKKSCGALPDFPNGKYTYPDGILFGATAIAQCNTGFSLLGENTRNCRENGWDGRDPVCEAVKCEPPPSIQNGTFDPLDDFYNYGQAVTYSCIRDYNLIGESTIVCSANGTFHPPPPRCLLVECEAPNIKNAVRVEGKPPPYRYKNFVRYQCNKGYIMNGSGYLVCEENGWNPPPPECITQCERPDVGENRVIVDDSGQKTFPNGSTLMFKCSTGYQPVDSSAPKIITCVGTEWTKLELNCTISRINLTTAPPSDSPCLKPCGIIIAVVVFLLLSF